MANRVTKNNYYNVAIVSFDNPAGIYFLERWGLSWSSSIDVQGAFIMLLKMWNAPGETSARWRRHASISSYNGYRFSITDWSHYVGWNGGDVIDGIYQIYEYQERYYDPSSNISGNYLGGSQSRWEDLPGGDANFNHAH